MNSDYEEDREILDTKGMLEDGFFKNLKNKGKVIPPAKTESSERSTIVSEKRDINTEQLLLNLFEIRDELIDVFKEIGIASKFSERLTSNINRLGSCIGNLGGKNEHFDPLSNVSGLQDPNLVKNAQRVIENTIDSYMGEIEGAEVKGKEITITFGGKVGDVVYRAKGTVASNGIWIGNEAIDYVYTPGEGKMSVKALDETGQWSEKSDGYKISWVLDENDLDGQELEIKEAEKKEENIEEEKEEVENNITDENISTDFPIEEK